MGLPPVENTVTSCLVNKTMKYASHMGTKTTRVLVKDGMMYPVVGKSAANCRIVSETVADNLFTCPVAMNTLIFGALVLGGTCRSAGAM